MKNVLLPRLKHPKIKSRLSFVVISITALGAAFSALRLSSSSHRSLCSLRFLAPSPTNKAVTATNARVTTTRPHVATVMYFSLVKKFPAPSSTANNPACRDIGSGPLWTTSPSFRLSYSHVRPQTHACHGETKAWFISACLIAGVRLVRAGCHRLRISSRDSKSAFEFRSPLLFKESDTDAHDTILSLFDLKSDRFLTKP